MDEYHALANEPFLPKKIQNVGEFMNAIKTMKECHTGYELDTVQFYINNPVECNNALYSAPDSYFMEAGNILSYLIHEIYLNNIKCVFSNETIHGLLKPDSRIVFFAIYWDIPHIFRQVLKTSNFTYNSIQLYRAFIRYCILMSRYNYMEQLIEYSIPEIKIIMHFDNKWGIIQNCIDFDMKIHGIVKELYGIKLLTNNISIPTISSSQNDGSHGCNCLTNIHKKIAESYQLKLYDESNKNLNKMNCKTLMMLIYYGFNLGFTEEYSLIEPYDDLLAKILLKFCIYCNNLHCFKHIINNSPPKLNIVNDLPQHILENTENMDFLKFIFTGMCRTKKIIICENCNVGENVATIKNIQHDKETYNKCKTYIEKKMSKMTQQTNN